MGRKMVERLHLNMGKHKWNVARNICRGKVLVFTVCV